MKEKRALRKYVVSPVQNAFLALIPLVMLAFALSMVVTTLFSWMQGSKPFSHEQQNQYQLAYIDVVDVGEVPYVYAWTEDGEEKKEYYFIVQDTEGNFHNVRMSQSTRDKIAAKTGQVTRLEGYSETRRDALMDSFAASLGITRQEYDARYGPYIFSNGNRKWSTIFIAAISLILVAIAVCYLKKNRREFRLCYARLQERNYTQRAYDQLQNPENALLHQKHNGMVTRDFVIARDSGLVLLHSDIQAVQLSRSTDDEGDFRGYLISIQSSVLGECFVPAWLCRDYSAEAAMEEAQAFISLLKSRNCAIREEPLVERKSGKKKK